MDGPRHDPRVPADGSTTASSDSAWAARVPGRARRDGAAGPERPSLGRSIGATCLAGVAAAAVGLALAEVAAFLLRLAGGSSGPASTTLRGGVLLFEAFHRVPLVFELGLRSVPGEATRLATVTFGGAPMLGTCLAVGALWAAGRIAARAWRAEGTLRVLAGASVAVPYALACWALGLAAGATVGAPGSLGALLQGSFRVHPDAVASVLWPLGIGLVAGASGAFVDARSRRQTGGVDADAVSGALRGGVVGAWTALAMGLALAFVGLLVLAAVQPAATRAYLNGAFGGGATRGVAVVGLTLLAVPNMATWVLSAASGGCVAVASAGRTACAISYAHLPTLSTLTGLQSSAAGNGQLPVDETPRGYLLFLLVPLLATVLGGFVAAGRARAGRALGAVAGAVAGLGFAALSLAVAFVARLSLAVDGAGSTIIGGPDRLWAGPAPVVAFVLALAWGIAGGAAGGALRTGRRSAVPVVGGAGNDAHDQDGQAEEPQDDAGDGEPAPVLDAARGVDLAYRQEAEDHGQHGPDPEDPDQPEDQRGDGHAVGPGGGGVPGR
jgi:hypothetical protein